MFPARNQRRITMYPYLHFASLILRNFPNIVKYFKVDATIAHLIKTNSSMRSNYIEKSRVTHMKGGKRHVVKTV